MNFKTRRSYNDMLSFIYSNGDIKKTSFCKVAYYGDNYVLAKCHNSSFYTLLDLDGNRIKDNAHIVHRFHSGLLLTYSCFEKEYVSSDGLKYSVNYNVFSVLNATTGKSAMINILQADSLLTKVVAARKVVISSFLNREIYSFSNLIFSEFFDMQLLITGSILDLGLKHTDTVNFDVLKKRKIWSVTDVFSQKSHTGETNIKVSVIENVILEEALVSLADMMATAEQPVEADYVNDGTYGEAVLEYQMLASWQNKSRLKMMFKNILAFAQN